MNTFKFVGKIKKIEDKKDKKFIETVTFDSGWMIERVKFRVDCGECSGFVDLSGGKFKDDSKNVIYTQQIKAGATNKRDVENVQIAWADRFDPAIIEKIPNYRRYTVDLASDKIREALVDAKKEDEAAELSKQKHSYISTYDFAKKVEEILLADGFGEDNYVVTGTIEYSYSNKKDDGGKYFRSFVPTNIYKASDKDTPGLFGKIDFYYDRDNAVGEEMEDGNTPISGYMQFYERMSKQNYYVETGLILKKDNPIKNGLINTLTKLGDMESPISVVGVNVTFFEGTPKTEINIEDLSDEQKQMLEWGVKTMDDIRAEMGNAVYGDRVSYIYLDGLSRGYANGPQATEVDMETLQAKPTGERTTKNTTTTKTSAKKFDLFSDEDDI